MMGERYYLLLLLMRVPGGTSFEHLRTVDRIVHPVAAVVICYSDTCVYGILIGKPAQVV